MARSCSYSAWAPPEGGYESLALPSGTLPRTASSVISVAHCCGFIRANRPDLIADIDNALASSAATPADFVADQRMRNRRPFASYRSADAAATQAAQIPSASIVGRDRKPDRPAAAARARARSWSSSSVTRPHFRQIGRDARARARALRNRRMPTGVRDGGRTHAPAGNRAHDTR